MAFIYIKFVKRIQSQNTDQPEVQLSVGIFEVDVLAHVSWRISSWPSYAINTPSWQVPPAVLTAVFFRI